MHTFVSKTLHYCTLTDKQEVLNNISSSKQKSTSLASNSASSGDVASPSQRDTSPANSRIVPSSLAYTLGHMGAGSPAIAAAASQAIVATQQVLAKIFCCTCLLFKYIVIMKIVSSKNITLFLFCYC